MTRQINAATKKSSLHLEELRDNWKDQETTTATDLEGEEEAGRGRRVGSHGDETGLGWCRSVWKMWWIEGG